MCALFLRGVRDHAVARRRQQVGEVVCAIRSARRARQVDVDVGGLLLRPPDRRRRCGADSAGASMKALDKKSGKSTTSTAAPPARAASFTSEPQAEGAVEKAPDRKSGESTSTVAPPVRVRHAMPVRFSSSMVGSVPHKHFAYSDPDRQSIKASFTLVGIDADAETVGERWWAQSNPAAALVAEPRRPLLEQLQEMAGDHLGLVELGKSLTPQQRKALNNLKT